MELSCKQFGPMLKTLKNHWFSLLFGDLAVLGSVLEASWSVLEASWSRLGAAAATDAAFDATEAASKRSLDQPSAASKRSRTELCSFKSFRPFRLHRVDCETEVIIYKKHSAHIYIYIYIYS